MTIAGNTFQALLEAAAVQFSFDIRAEAVAFCKEWVYWKKSEERKTLRCFDEERGRSFYCDCESGEEVNVGLFFDSILLPRPSSKLPSLPNRQPFVFIRTDTDLLTTNRDRGLEAAPESALSDCSFVALLRGVRSGKRLFPETGVGYFSDPKSAELFLWHEIPGRAEKRRFLLLLREGGPVPRLVHPKVGFYLWKRSGLQLRFREGCVRREGAAEGDTERWRKVESDQSFYKEFAAEMKK